MSLFKRKIRLTRVKFGNDTKKGRERKKKGRQAEKTGRIHYKPVFRICSPTDRSERIRFYRIAICHFS